jgi:hypothetical protein
MVRSCDRIQGVASELVLIPESKRLTLIYVADLYVAFFCVKEFTVKEYPATGRLSHERIVIVQGANR